VLANLLFETSRRDRPVSIEGITRFFLARYGANRSQRTVKRWIENLRSVHQCLIGARREEPAGYFWVLTADDTEEATRPYLQQIKTMWRTARVVLPKHRLLELLGQLAMDTSGGTNG